MFIDLPVCLLDFRDYFVVAGILYKLRFCWDRALNDDTFCWLISRLEISRSGDWEADIQVEGGNVGLGETTKVTGKTVRGSR